MYAYFQFHFPVYWRFFKKNKLVLKCYLSFTCTLYPYLHGFFPQGMCLTLWINFVYNKRFVCLFSLTILICLLILVFNTLITSFVLLLLTWLYWKWCIYLSVMVYHCCTPLVILCHIVPLNLHSPHKFITFKLFSHSLVQLLTSFLSQS